MITSERTEKTMTYDFTTILDRRGQDAIAVDLPNEGKYGVKAKEGYDIIPMWVADMNFPVYPGIQKAVIGRTEIPHFGYFEPRKEYFDAIINWQKTRNGVEGLKAENIGYENGVLGGVISAVNVLASRGDNVLVHSPTYIGFTHSLEGNGYHIIHSQLHKDENNVWQMDYEDMEKKIVDNKIHVAIICNPHNPCGRVWTREELEKVMEIFEKHNVWIIADEIWSDIMLDGHKHLPVQSVNQYAHDHTAAFYAPSKTFNLAGLIGSYHIIYNPWLRERIEKESSLSHYNAMNVLSMYALIGAYEEGGMKWLDELREVLSANAKYACDFIENNFKGIKVSRPQGTYMLFLDCEDYCKANNLDMDALLKKGWEVGVYWQDGRPFHGTYGIRLNLALPTSRVKEAFDRLQKALY